MSRLHILIAISALTLISTACQKTEPQEEQPDPQHSSGTGLEGVGAHEEPSLCDHDVIPDFSRVGYKYSDEPIPTYPVKETLSPEVIGDLLAKGAYKDTTECIQAAIDRVGNAGGGAVLLEEGTYNTHGTLFIDYDNTVLRGSGESRTRILAHGTRKMATIFIGRSVTPSSGTPDSLIFAGRKLAYSYLRAADQYNHFGDYYLRYFAPAGQGITYGAGSEIDEEYVPVGRLELKVKDASIFAPGERIAIFRPYSDEWISDVGMNRIAKNGREGINSGTTQWNEQQSSFQFYWLRRIVSIKNNIISLDAPIVQAIDAAYGGGIVYKADYKIISGSGVEDMTIESTCRMDKSDPNLYYKNQYIDEAHSWYAVSIKSAEHCWIRNITSLHYGMSLASLGARSRCVTVQNCKCLEPVSIVNGGRRYAFNLSGAELCLVRECLSDNDRHAFITNVSKGPNVFLNCTTTNFTGSIGPHQHWGTGDLYDNVVTDNGKMEAYDRGNSGTGHGWAGANYVYWNCKAVNMTCQSPWALENSPELENMAGGNKFHSTHPSARNYVIGFIGKRHEQPASNYESPYSGFPKDGITDYYVQLGYGSGDRLVRPAAQWYPMIEPNQTNSTKVMLPDKEAAAKFDWWPELTLETYSHPESLYECLLEDRHARGIFLNSISAML